MPQKAERKFIIRYEKQLAPGDYVVTSALVRDLKLTYGDRYQIDVETNMGALFEANPHITKLQKNDSSVEVITLGYKQGMDSSSAGNHHHFLTWPHRDFAAKTKIPVYPLLPRPDLHLTEEEKASSPISGKYWLVFGGGKSDVTIKHWDYDRYQEVVNKLRGKGLRFAQSGATVKGHTHPIMDDVLNLVGWGYLRELLWQIYHCEGVICPITAAMHIAAAFEKPCVVIAGGREEPWWEAYTNDYKQFGNECEPVKVEHEYIHTVGTDMDCCLTRGCWKNKVVKIDKDLSVCTKLASRALGAQELPECMGRITVDHVCEAVMSYYENGTLDQPVDWRAIAEPQIIADEIPWQPMSINTNDGQPLSADVRRGAKLAEPKLGGKLTICVGCIGDYTAMQVRCLDSIMQTVPRIRMDLRVGLAGVNDILHDYCGGSIPATKFYDHPVKVDKYALLRQMLHDEEHPIETNFVAWFDDVCWIVHAHWLNQLAELVLKQPPNVAMYGVKVVEPFVVPSDADPVT